MVSSTMDGKHWLIASFALSLVVQLDAQQIPAVANCTSWTWVQFTDTLIYGGSQNPALSIPACQNACLASPGCQSVDWSPQNQPESQCFLLSTQNNKVNATGVIHFDLNCTVASTSTITGLPSSTRLSTTFASTTRLSTTLPPTTPSPTPGPPTTLSANFSTKSPPQGSAQRDCNTTYEIFLDTSSPNADPVPEIRDIQTCYKACTLLRSCSGFDFSQTTGCWIHVNATDFDQKFYQPGVTQYKVNRCPEEGINDCIEIPAVDVCDESCLPKWARYENTAGSGGQSFAISYTNNYKGCLTACFNQTNCIGIEWTALPGSDAICTYYNSSQQSALTSTSLKPFVTQYRLLSRCGTFCQSFWQLYNNSRLHTVNATNRTDVTNSSGCETACRLSRTCKAYTFTRSGPFVCTVADDFYDGSNYTAPNISTYVYRIGCNDSHLLLTTPTPQSSATTISIINDSCSWIQFNKTNIFGGVSVGASTLSACQSSCRNTTTCQGIDWAPENPAGLQCYLLATQLGKNQANWNVTHYDLNCNSTSGLSSTAAATTFTALTSTTTSSISTISTTLFADPCSWIQFNKTNIFGGVSVGASTLSACQSFCRNTTTCQGIDWAPENPAGQQCYLLATQLGKNQANWNVTHYDLNCNATSTPTSTSTNSSINTTTSTSTSTSTSSTTSAPSSTTTSNSSAVCTFVRLNNTIIYGGTGNTAPTLDDCKSACLSNPSCQSLDWSLTNPVGQQCFLLSTQNGKNPTTNVDHYDRLCTAGCTWTTFTDRNVFGGTINPANDVSSCQAACLAISGCKGLDWVPGNSPGQRCFTFTLQGDKYSAPGVTHYDLTC